MEVVATDFGNLLGTAINVLGTDGVNQASVDLSGNGYTTPILANANGAGYSGGYSTAAGGGGLLILVVLAFFFLR